MFGIVIKKVRGEDRILTLLPYSREALKHNWYGLIRVRCVDGSLDEIPWGRIKDYYAPRWVTVCSASS